MHVMLDGVSTRVTVGRCIVRHDRCGVMLTTPPDR